MSASILTSAISSIPAGPWAVGVSGGADSVALLSLLRERSDLSLHVVHLNHQTRGAESEADARFVTELAQEWNLRCTIEQLERVIPQLDHVPPNPSAKYRAARFALFGRVVDEHRLAGVVLAHHADDQAETVLQRLLRGSGYVGLAGMCRSTIVGKLRVERPLLNVSRQDLRNHLNERQLSWREDRSNESDAYLRNRLRKVLTGRPPLAEDLLLLAGASGRLRDWARSSAPALAEQFNPAELTRLPGILAAESARRWLIERGVPVEQIDPAGIERLLTMAGDAASSPRFDYPGGVRVYRRKGKITAGSI